MLCMSAICQTTDYNAPTGLILASVSESVLTCVSHLLGMQQHYTTHSMPAKSRLSIIMASIAATIAIVIIIIINYGQPS